MITTLAKVIALPGQESSLAEVCINLAKETRANEKGCLQYYPYVSAENPAEIIIIGKYTDEQAVKAHLESPHAQVTAGKLQGLVAEKVTDILDGKLIINVLQELI